MRQACNRLTFAGVGLSMAIGASLSVSCTSEASLVRQWKERIELDIGERPERATNGKKPVSMTHRSAELDEYAYRDGKCRWTYFVSRNTGLIEGWRYDSEPGNCQVSYCFFCSW